ncbi:MAG: aminotransferase class I/II-fold pyridoxal phosphate-dependent enzyme [Sphingomonadaceae bacterium]|nr:aminotransferase class I/II-fold pyridoxal phosphate-dependent enzyme [Sphingomonadaceae bacterium]
MIDQLPYDVPPPWPPLLPGGEDLRHWPEPPAALRARMSEIYGVPVDCVLPVVGRSYPRDAIVQSLRGPDGDDGPQLRLLSSPSVETGAVVRADQLPDGLIYVDETAIEYADDHGASLAPIAASSDRLFVYRSLGPAYGLAGLCLGAVISGSERIAALERVALSNPVPTPVVRLAEQALHPSRIAAVLDRIAAVKAERERLRAALGCAPSHGNWLILERADRQRFETFGIRAQWQVTQGAERGLEPQVRTHARVGIGTPEENDRLLAAMGLSIEARAPGRRAEVVRDTKETRIVCSVDLDARTPVRIATGVGFYDHMLEQVARHGGFSLRLSCEGDLHIEAHHTIEDCALALGEALRASLGDRAGVARFGFDGPRADDRFDGNRGAIGSNDAPLRHPAAEDGSPPQAELGEQQSVRFAAPLDEAVASVVLDLSGRPLARFSGSFARPMIGAFPTEMVPHVFRSIADALRATIHVSVTGEDDHHQIEACFKAFGRALRMAISREGGGVPSTKGVLA